MCDYTILPWEFDANPEWLFLSGCRRPW